MMKWLKGITQLSIAVVCFNASADSYLLRCDLDDAPLTFFSTGRIGCATGNISSGTGTYQSPVSNKYYFKDLSTGTNSVFGMGETFSDAWKDAQNTARLYTEGYGSISSCEKIATRASVKGDCSCGFNNNLNCTYVSYPSSSSVKKRVFKKISELPDAFLNECVKLVKEIAHDEIFIYNCSIEI